VEFVARRSFSKERLTAMQWFWVNFRSGPARDEGGSILANDQDHALLLIKLLTGAEVVFIRPVSAHDSWKKFDILGPESLADLEIT
jgi:hypothetical protein